MMKTLKKWLCLVAIFTFALGFMGIFQTRVGLADDASTEVTEAPYASVWVNELVDFTQSGATHNTTTNGVDNLVSMGRFGYRSPFENVEVKSIVRWSSITGGNANFHLRLQGDVVNASYTTGGYSFRWYSHGQYEVLKNFVVVVGPTWGPLPAPTIDTDYTVSLSTINLSDGSVKFTATVNGTKFFDYVDNTDPILGAGQYAVTLDGFSGSFNGNVVDPEAVYLNDLANPVKNANFPSATINNDKSVDISSTYGGAVWSFQTSNSFSYKFDWTPSATGTSTQKFRMTIGSKGTVHRYEHMASPGYTFQWNGNGQRYLFVQGVSGNNYVWNMPKFTADKTYTVECGIISYGDGTNRVYLKVDGKIYINYFDVATDTHTPVSFAKSGSPGALLTHVIVYGENVSGKISANGSSTYQEKTLLTSDLGNAASNSGATFDRNGGITNICGGLNAGYNGSLENTVIKMKGKFTSVGSMIMQLRAKGSYDTPWGGGWTNRGYAVYLYSNGQTILAKNGSTICEGFALGSTNFSANTEYEIEFGTINVSSTAVRVYAKVNGDYAVNYLDNNNAILGEGWFTIFNNTGMAGSLMPTVDYPTLSADLETGVNALVGEEVNLNTSGTDITYLVDTEKSTGSATINGNKLTPNTSGVIVAYALSDGLYSNDIEFTAQTAPVLTNVPAELRLGETATINAENQDGTEILTKKFYIISTGEATINEDTGLITPISAGTVSVYAIVNGIKTNEQTIIIKNATVYTLTGAPSQIVFGSPNVILDAVASDSTEITTKVFKLENLTGEASINESTGEITPIKAGKIRVYAIVNGEETQTETITIVPVLTTMQSFGLIKTQGRTLNYSLNCPIPSTATCTWEIVSNDGVISLNATTGEVEALKSGTATVKMVVACADFNLESEIITISVKTPLLILPIEPIVYGGQAYSVNAKFDDDSAFTSIEFFAEPVSGQATIDAETGLITPVKAGTFKVYAMLDGVKTEEKVLTVIPKVFVYQVGSFAFTGVYELNGINGLWGANCELPNEEITVEFEIVSGSEFATLSSTGVLTAGSTPGVVGLRVHVTGETFLATSEVTNFAIEQPRVIVQNSFLEDLHVGQSATLTPSISQGGITITSSEIVAISGGDCVSINGTTITAVKGGTFKFKIIVNGTWETVDTALEIAIEELVPTIIANEEMSASKTQQATIMFNSTYFTPNTIVWSVIQGKDVVSIDQNGLITAIKEGKAKIKALVNGEYVATLEITVNGKVVISGIAQNANMLVGGAIDLSYTLNDMEIEGEPVVEYIVVSGQDCVALSIDGKVTALKSGKVQIKVVVNGVESQILTFNVVNNYTETLPEDQKGEQNQNDGKLALILGLSGGGAVLVAGGVATPIIIRKRKIKKGGNK